MSFILFYSNFNNFCFLIISLPKLLLLNNIPTILDLVVGTAYPDPTLISETRLETKCENTSVKVQKNVPRANFSIWKTSYLISLTLNPPVSLFNCLAVTGAAPCPEEHLAVLTGQGSPGPSSLLLDA